MLKFVILLSVIAVAFGAALTEGMLSQTDGRIVGGIETTIFSFPWQVSLQHSDQHICGGAIYNANIIITAAHCVQKVSPSDLKVRAGSSFWNTDGVLINVAGFRRHEGYNPKTMANDIAVIYLSSALMLSSTIKPISLATKAPADGAAASVSGWGATNYGSNNIPEQLQYIDVNIISTKQCRSTSYQYGREIKSGMICAYAVGKDTCQMDSGSPLVSGGLLVGVVSWGYGCAQHDYPSVYADVAELAFWIKLAADSYQITTSIN